MPNLTEQPPKQHNVLKVECNGGGRLKLVHEHERSWGTKVNGSFTGLLGIITREEADVFVGPVQATLERISGGDMTPAYLHTDLRLMTKKPLKYVDPFSFARSLNVDVWVILLVALILVAAFLTILQVSITERQGGLRMRSRFGANVWLCYTCFFASCGRPQNFKVRERFLLGSWSLAVVVVGSTLSSRLVSTMLVKNTEDHVEELEDVLRFPNLKILVQKNTRFEEFVTKPQTRLFRELRKRLEAMEDSIRPGPQQDAFFDKAEQGSHVIIHETFFQDAALAQRYSRRGHCSFRKPPPVLALQPVGMLLRKTLDESIKKTIAMQCRRMAEMQLQRRPMEPFIVNASKCYQEDAGSVYAFRLDELQGAFLLWTLGSLAAIFVLCAELSIYAARKSILSRKTSHVKTLESKRAAMHSSGL
ncbi:probable glutamate receptor [Ornithodoros turicata]|uniref:probable glutamate receptor n=1 Tax=Ornithodoros turicata TaxID=34597 RepID=UPI0031389F85